MQRLNFLKTFISLVVIIIFPSVCYGQTGLVSEYDNAYRLEKTYSIVYDNPTQLTKLKTFKLEFYGDGETLLGVTEAETYPENATSAVYSLANPIVGFKKTKLFIINVYEGDPNNFPSGSVLGLNKDQIIKNNPPEARDVNINIEATDATITRNLSSRFDNPDRDGDDVKLRAASAKGPLFSYTIKSNGDLIITSPSTSGQQILSYTVEDTKKTTASAKITINVGLPQKIKDRVERLKILVRNLKKEILLKETVLSNLAGLSPELESALNILLQETETLSETAIGSKNIAVKSQLDGLADRLKQALIPSSETELLETISNLKVQQLDLRTKLENLSSDIENGGVSLGDISAGLTPLENKLPIIKAELNTLQGPATLSPAALEGFKAEQIALANQISSPALPWPLIIAGLAILLGGLFLFLKLSGPAILRPASTIKQRNFSAAKRPPPSGIIFPESPLAAGAATAGPAALAPLGKMLPSGLQTLTGQYTALKPAYEATGRIGGPQEGIPTNDDVAFGTGFLITPNHVMTNQHVYEFYKHYLTGEDCGGIEFIAERGREASDYVAFNGDMPLIIPTLDIAIFTLKRRVTNRTPIDRIAIPTKDLDERDVVAVSYPCPFELDEVILSAVEKDPVFAVKRISQGRIFKHSTDTDTPYGVDFKVEPHISMTKKLPAICHSASTAGGSSGAPILDMTGQLVGVHFAGDRAFNGKEAANLAMAIERLVEANTTVKGDINIA